MILGIKRLGIRDTCRLKICCLSVEEAARLEVYGIWYNCKNHVHLSKRQAAEYVERDETHRFCGGKDTKVEFVSAIVPTNTSQMWQPVQNHDWDGKRLMGARTWGLPALG